MIQKHVGGVGCAVTNKNKNEQAFDSIRRQKLDAGLQPFKLVKYFSFSSLAVILIFTLFLSWYISKHSEAVMLEQSEEYTFLLAENINQQVFLRFVLPTVIRYGKIALREPGQYKLINKIITSLIEGMNIKAVTIFDSGLNVISYSTIPERIGLKDQGGEGYKLALSGKPNSKLTQEGSVFSLISVAKPISCELITHIPFRQVRQNGESDGIIMGVIQIERDLTKEYTNILRLQGRLILVSSLVMLVMFVVLRTIVSRADKIMEKRSEERLRLEEKLNQAERLAHLGTMVATVSHEIKSPLGIVRSTAEILQKRIKKIAPGSEHLASIIIDETTRLNGIVVEFLDFARPQKMNFVVDTVEETLNKVLDFVSPHLKEQDIRLVTDFAPSLPQNLLDKNAFYRALLNIIMNAIQAMSKGGQLQVTTDKGPQGATLIIIKDTGRGIAEEKIPQIFNPFFTDRHKGTGLGLAITANIVEGHGGTIDVQSVLDEGSSFTITIPKAV